MKPLFILLGLLLLATGGAVAAPQTPASQTADKNAIGVPARLQPSGPCASPENLRHT